MRDLFKEPTDSKALIFSSSKMKVKELAHTLKRMHLDVAPMHSDLEQAQREEVMLNYKNNKVKILVATDIVARGIDIEDIALVINYDVPHDPEDYIHRIGRTARAAATGAAITFVSVEEQGKFHRIEEFIEREIPKRELPDGMEGPAYDPAGNRGFGGRGGRAGRSGNGGRSEKGGRGGRRDKNRREGGGRNRSVEPANVASQNEAPQPTPVPDNDHAAGRGEGNRGTRDRKRRHRGGRRHRKPTDAAATPAEPSKNA